MSTTFAITTVNNTNNISKKKRTRLFLSHLYHYVAITLQFIYSLLPTKKTKKIPTPNSVALQYYKGKTLVLDLDETLVHSVRLGSETVSAVSPSIIHKTIEVQCDKQSLLYEVYKRPHVDFFLKTVRRERIL